MMRLFYSCLLTFIVTCSLHAQSWNWAKRYGGPNTESGTDQVIDAQGNTFTLSTANNSVNFGSGPILTNGGSDALVTKHNPSGLLVWYRLIGGTGSEGAAALVMDASGNIYASGSFDGTMICGNDTLTSVNDDIYVVKLNSLGQIVWGRRAGSAGTASEYPVDAAYSASDNSIVLTGKLADTATFGSYTVANSQTFLAKIDANGNWMWAIAANPGDNALAGAVACDAVDNIYVSTSVPVVMELQKYTPAGNQMWTRNATDVSFGEKICFDASGDFYVIGNYNTPFSIGSVNMPLPSGTWGGFLIRFDSSGTALWGKDFQSGGMWLHGIDVSPTGDIYICGDFTNTLYTDTTLLADLYNDALEGFIVKMNSSGNFRWFKQVGASGTDRVKDVTYLAGKIYFSGCVEGTTNGSFSPISIAGAYGNLDALIGQFNDCSPPLTQVLPNSVIQICENDSIHLYSTNSSGSNAYMWQINGVPQTWATTPYLDMASDPLLSGAYAIQVTANGCTYISHYVDVFVYPLPSTSISTTNYGPSCDRDSVKLTAGFMSLHTYHWLMSGVPIPGANTNIYMVHNTGDYSVVVTSPFGCSDTISIPTVILGQYPVITASADTAICYGSSFLLYSSGANSYAWTPTGSLTNPSSATPTAQPFVNTTYRVIGTVGSCRDTEYVVVQVHPLPVATASYNGYQLSCSSSTAQDYQWYLNSVLLPGDTLQMFTPSTNGTYYCIVTDSNGCTDASNTIAINNVGIEEEQRSSGSLIIYPQPMMSELTIQFPYVIDEGVLELYSLSGEIVVKETLSNSLQITLERNGLSSGMYILKIISARGELRSRVLVE